MNKKGFTLIELIAVIVILSLLILLVSKGVAKVVKDNKKDLGDTQEQLIIEAAQLYMEDHLDLLPDDGNCRLIELNTIEPYFNSFSNLKTNIDLNDYSVNVCNNTGEIEYELVNNNE